MCSHKKKSLFLNFAGKSRVQKLSKAQTKRVEIMYIFLRVSIGGVNLVFCTLSYLCFNSLLFAPTSLLEYATAGVRRPPPPPDRLGIRNSNTSSPLTYYEDLATAEPLHRPPCFHRCIFFCACRRLLPIPPFPQTLEIHRHCRHQL